MNSSPAHPTHLIIVCCHAIYLGGPTRGQSEEEWLLASFQSGETPTFMEHLRKGLTLLSSDASSILVLSGSRTRQETEKSEARGYLDLCLDNEFWGIPASDGHGGDGADFEKRVLLEEQALDSFGNLMFSLLGFWKVVGRWPERITIVSHEFKRRRFMELHVKAARWPAERAEFVGVDPDYMVRGCRAWDETRAEEVWRGEKERGFKAWERDVLGMGEGLRRKRMARDCWKVSQVWFGSGDDRRRSWVKSRVVEREDGVMEEVLSDETQPWEEDE